jgi:hypothetical protein
MLAFVRSFPARNVSFQNLTQGASFQAFTVVKIQVEVLWLVTPRSVVVGYQNFRVPC